LTRGEVKTMLHQCTWNALRHLRVELATDAELLDLFVGCRDQAAIELLVRRHAATVLGVCRRVLGDAHEAEDAFQATFLVFARKAASIGKREAIGSWLHKVAFRVALRLRISAARRATLPLDGDALALTRAPGLDDPAVSAVRHEVGQALDEEIRRLPEQYRAAVVLHYLQGRPCREVACELGWPLATVATRLAKARNLLQQRLVRRGITLPAGLGLAVLASANAVEATAGLLPDTARTALWFAAGQPRAAGVVSTKAIILAQGVLHTMRMTRWTIAVALLAVAMCGAWCVLTVRSPGQAGQLAAFVGDKKQPVVPPKPDWPMFGGTPSRNMVNLAAKNVLTKFDIDTGKGIKWKAALGEWRALAGPVIAGGRVFVGTNNENPRDEKVKGDHGILMCFDEATGKFLWQAAHQRLPERFNDWPKIGITSTPTVDGDKLYYVSNRCTVVCATTAGKGGKADIVWEFDMIKELGVFPHDKSPCSPLVAGDSVFVVTANGVDESHVNIPAPRAPSFIALDKNTGKLLWKDSSPGKDILHGQWSSPTYAEIAGQKQVIFPGGDGWLRAFEPATGKLLWKFDCNPKDAVKSDRSDFLATAVVYQGKVYIGVGQDPEHRAGVGHLWCIDPAKPKMIPADGDISPELVVGPQGGAPVIKANPDSGLAWHYGGLNKNANAKREYIFGRTLSTCAIHDGLVYAAELNGYLHCLDAKTGEVYWVHDLRAEVWGSPYWVDGKVFVATLDGELWIFNHGKKAGKAQVIDLVEPIRTTPVVANGVLYLMDGSNLYAIGNK
jgi:RNA polymerase sigma factor (sigma-70 family)